MPYVSTRLGRWFYEEHGDSSQKLAIVCLHGLLFDGGQWKEQVGPLSAIGRTIVFDGPGHGKSEVPPLFTLNDHADALADALAELGVERAALVGLSWGGMLAMRFALRHRSMLLGMALLDTSAEREKPALRVRFRAFALFHEHVGIPYALYARDIAPRMFGKATRRNKPDLVERTGRALLGFPRLGVARAALAVVINRDSVLEELSRVQVESLVVCGDEDRATPLSKSRNLARVLGARLVVIASSGHMTALERPADVNAELVPFLSGLLSSRA
ncbi:MAG: alpha/beta fold hydrolase [Myxococcales bacterium]|nr:alpha/beta fold hydrolase [Myxococcales bacterium]MBL9110256.1 alpha/beta fold hydrolase [Myxococcales bacterium]